jgi:hypothetical protein
MPKGEAGNHGPKGFFIIIPTGIYADRHVLTFSVRPVGMREVYFLQETRSFFQDGLTLEGLFFHHNIIPPLLRRPAL